MSDFVLDPGKVSAASNREEILDWVRAHGLDPELVRSTRVIGPLIRVVEYELDEQGRKYLRGNEPATRVRWVRLRERPPRVIHE